MLLRLYVPPTSCRRRSSAESSVPAPAFESKRLGILLPTLETSPHSPASLYPRGFQTCDPQTRESILCKGLLLGDPHDLLRRKSIIGIFGAWIANVRNKMQGNWTQRLRRSPQTFSCRGMCLIVYGNCDKNACHFSNRRVSAFETDETQASGLKIYPRSLWPVKINTLFHGR